MVVRLLEPEPKIADQRGRGRTPPPARRPRGRVVCHASASTSKPVPISADTCTKITTVITASWLPSHSHNKAARNAGSTGGIQAVGPVVSFERAGKAFARNHRFGDVVVFRSEMVVHVRIDVRPEGGKYFRFARSVTVYDRLAQIVHPAIAAIRTTTDVALPKVIAGGASGGDSSTRSSASSSGSG